VRYYLELFLGGGRYENPLAKLRLGLFATPDWTQFPKNTVSRNVYLQSRHNPLGNYQRQRNVTAVLATSFSNWHCEHTCTSESAKTFRQKDECLVVLDESHTISQLVVLSTQWTDIDNVVYSTEQRALSIEPRAKNLPCTRYCCKFYRKFPGVGVRGKSMQVGAKFRNTWLVLHIKESRRGQRILTEEKLNKIVYILEEISKEIFDTSSCSLACDHWAHKHSNETMNLRPCNCLEVYLTWYWR